MYRYLPSLRVLPIKPSKVWAWQSECELTQLERPSSI